MAQIGEMLNQSVEVITKPSVDTFEQHEKKGNMQDALKYVAIAAGVAGLLGLGGGISGLISGVLLTLVGFFVFTYLVYWIGQQQGGTGTLDEVAYTFSLFWAPMSIVSGLGSLILAITVVGIVFIPILLLAVLVANVFFAYLAVQSSLNMTAQGKIWMTLILSALGTGVANAIITGILMR